jgi:hypothetical protein
MATRTWKNGGVDNNWNTDGNWVEGSKPAVGDDVIIAAAYNCVVNENTEELNSFDMTGYANTLSGAFSITVTPAAGTVACLFAGTITWTGALNLKPPAGVTINFTSGGATTFGTLTVTGTTTGTVKFLDAYTASGKTVNLAGGTLDSNGFNISIGLFSSNNAIARTLTMGDSTWTLNRNLNDQMWDFRTITNATLNSGTSTIIVNGQTSGNIFYTGSGLTYNKITLKTGSLGYITFSATAGLNTDYNLLTINSTKDVRFNTNTYHTIKSIQVSPTNNGTIVLRSNVTTGSMRYYLKLFNGPYNIKNCIISNCYQIAPTLLDATNNCVDAGGNMGIMFQRQMGSFIKSRLYTFLVEGGGAVAWTKSVDDSITATNTLSNKPNKIIADSITEVDSIIKAVNKIIADSVTESDSSARTLNKGIAQSVTLSDAINKLLGKITSDSVVCSNVIIKSTGKIISDSIVETDSSSRKPKKVVTDSSIISDSISKSSLKGIGQTIVITDSIMKLFGKITSQGVVVTNSVLKAFFKALSQSASVTDSVAKAEFKNLSQSVLYYDDVDIPWQGFVATRYITAPYKIPKHILNRMQQAISGISYDEVQRMKNDILMITTTKESDSMKKDLRQMNKDFE